jgi:N-acetylglucosaminyldiphosphoundecaprenol N-acetyl-beta-D-mannosaminyltransferase
VLHVRRILRHEGNPVTPLEDLMPNEKVYYDSWKEDRDIVLEYNMVKLDDANVVSILTVPVDNVTRSQAIVKVVNMINGGGIHHVMLLNPYKIFRIRSNNDLKTMSGKASMHLACGAGIPWAARMLRNPIKERIAALSFIMELIRFAEIKEYSIFIVGGKPEVAEKAFFNIKKSFPKIRIVGRHGGYFNPEREKSVIEAMRKSEARIILVGMGFPLEDKWINEIKNEFSNTVFISVGGSIDVISGDIKKAPAMFMERGLEWFYRIITRPWRLGRLFIVTLYAGEVVFKRLFKK